MSPAESFNSGAGAAIYSTAPNQHQHQAQHPSMQFRQQQVLQQQVPLEADGSKKLQRPKSANVPLTKDVVHNLQQQVRKLIADEHANNRIFPSE